MSAKDIFHNFGNILSQDIYQEFFIDSFIQSVLERYEIKLFFFHVQKQ